MLTELDTSKFLLEQGYQRGKFVHLFEGIKGCEQWAEQTKNYPRTMYCPSLAAYVFPNDIRNRLYGQYEKPAHRVVVEPFHIQETFQDSFLGNKGTATLFNTAYFYHLCDDKTPLLVTTKEMSLEQSTMQRMVDECNVFMHQHAERVTIDFPETYTSVLRWCCTRDFYYDEPAMPEELYQRFFDRNIKAVAAGRNPAWSPNAIRERLWKQQLWPLIQQSTRKARVGD